MATIWYSPDCEQGKHDACSGDAWDKDKDEPTRCGCCERQHKVKDTETSDDRLIAFQGVLRHPAGPERFA